MEFMQMLEALQKVLWTGKRIELLDLLDIVKSIAGVDMLQRNSFKALHKHGGFMLRVDENSGNYIRIEYCTDDGDTVVQIRKVELV